VDINPATVTKLMDRGTTQTVGIVSDAEPFLRLLVAELKGEREAGQGHAERFPSGRSSCPAHS
jgi:hypothetical protein